MAPGLKELFGEAGREALKVPVVVAEFDSVHGGAKFSEEPSLAEKSLNLGVFIDDAVEFVGVVDGGIGVIEAIVNKGVGEQNDFFGERPDFKVEAEVLVGGAWGGEEADVVP